MADLKPCPFCGGEVCSGTYGDVQQCLSCWAEAGCDDNDNHNWNHRPIEDAKDATIERLREICGEYWRTLCHYDHDDISTNWDQYADGAPIPPKDERYAQACRELAEAKQDLVEAQCDGERLRGLLGEARIVVIDHKKGVWTNEPMAEDDLLARIDAELKGDGDG